MKHFILTLFILTLFIGCDSSHNEETVIEMGNNKESDISASCNCDDLDANSENLLILDSKVFTGTCFLNYPQSDQKYIEKQILNGKVHGKITYFDKLGELLFEETYNNGNLVGDLENNTKCDCSDIVIKESEDFSKNYLNDILYTGGCEDFYPNSDQLYLESNYKNGLLNGFTIYYQKDGSVLIMQEYKDGVLIEDIVPQN